MQRRHFSGAFTGLAAAAALPFITQNSWGQASPGIPARLQQLERESGGRLGVAILDTATGQQYGWRAAERFPMCSTFKLLAAALVLHRVDQGKDQLDRAVKVNAADIVANWSPLTRPHAGGTMTLAELCEAAIVQSDNTAANLLLNSFGGPRGLTAYARSLGDGLTRLDRIEPMMSESRPGDPRDTTTPAAMLATVQKIVLGDALSAASREQMRQWLYAVKTSDRKLRALMPAGWQVGDKTGSGPYGTSNDIGVLWPAGGRAPIVVTVYLTETRGTQEERDLVVAKVGAVAALPAG